LKKLPVPFFVFSLFEKVAQAPVKGVQAPFSKSENGASPLLRACPLFCFILRQ
jgi:hypothetical protein